MTDASIKGQVPSHAALLIVDMINNLDSHGGPAMLPAAAHAIAALSRGGREAGVAVVMSTTITVSGIRTAR